MPAFRHISSLVSRVEGRRAETSHARVIIGIAGSPGSGKSTLATAVVDALNARNPGTAAYLPMDGFHLANSTLKTLEIHDKKGAIDTFDGWGFVSLVSRLRSETDHDVYAPSFNRTVDEGVAGEVVIPSAATVVIVEGNYLLADIEPWTRVKDLLDEVCFCSTPEHERERRLVTRHIRHGRTSGQAQSWARDVDGVNACLIEATQRRAALTVSGVTGEILSST